MLKLNYLFEILKCNMKKIAIISNRFLSEDLRGSEEVQKNLTKMLESEFTINILTSDIVDLEPLTSPLSRRIKRSEIVLSDSSKVFRFKSHPFVSSFAFLGSTLFSKLPINTHNEIKYFIDLLQVIGWGPLIPTIQKHISTLKYDLIIGSTFPSTPSYIAFRAAQANNIPFIYSPYLHFNFQEVMKNEILRIMIKKSTALIALTSFEKKKLISLGAEDKSTFVIPLSYDLNSNMGFRLDMDEAKKRLGLSDKFIILTVPHEHKGGLQTLDAAALLSDKYDNIYVISIGNTKNNYNRHAINLKKRYKNFNFINYGWVGTQTKFLLNSAANVFSMPSITDSFGLSYLDAWSCDTPIIGARGSAVEDIIDQGINGYLVTFGDVNELFLYLSNLYQSSQISSVMGKNGHFKIKEKYDPESVKNQYLEIIEYAMK